MTRVQYRSRLHGRLFDMDINDLRRFASDNGIVVTSDRLDDIRRTILDIMTDREFGREVQVIKSSGNAWYVAGKDSRYVEVRCVLNVPYNRTNQDVTEMFKKLNMDRTRVVDVSCMTLKEGEVSPEEADTVAAIMAAGVMS